MAGLEEQDPLLTGPSVESAWGGEEDVGVCSEPHTSITEPLLWEEAPSRQSKCSLAKDDSKQQDVSPVCGSKPES